MRVLIVRPAPGNAATAKAVAEMGHEPVCAPLFDVVPVAWDEPDPAQFDAVVMTSANAARHGGAGLSTYAHLPLFAVGEATASAARAANFTDLHVGVGDAAELGRALSGRVLHLTGTEHRPVPTAADVTAVIVYDSHPLSPEALPATDVALVHSPRAGARLAELTPDRAATQIVAISAAASHACGPGWAAIHIADIPREHAMLATLARVCEAAATTQPGRTS